MRLPLPKFVVRWIIRRARKRPYYHLPNYMDRFWLLGGSYRDFRSEQERGWKGTRFDAWIGQYLAIRIHHIYRSDLDRHLHDHPADNLSLLLQGHYLEVMPADKGQDPKLDQDHRHLTWVPRRAGDVIFRAAEDRHRLVVDTPVWSMWVLLKKRRRWGFHTENGWIHWREYEKIPLEERRLPYS